LGETFVIMSPQSKYWGDVSPLSHRDRRPFKLLYNIRREAKYGTNKEISADQPDQYTALTVNII